jgi:hypothetical protein
MDPSLMKKGHVGTGRLRFGYHNNFASRGDRPFARGAQGCMRDSLAYGM